MILCKLYKILNFTFSRCFNSFCLKTKASKAFSYKLFLLLYSFKGFDFHVLFFSFNLNKFNYLRLSIIFVITILTSCRIRTLSRFWYTYSKNCTITETCIKVKSSQNNPIYNFENLYLPVLILKVDDYAVEKKRPRIILKMSVGKTN